MAGTAQAGSSPPPADRLPQELQPTGATTSEGGETPCPPIAASYAEKVGPSPSRPTQPSQQAPLKERYLAGIQTPYVFISRAIPIDGFSDFHGAGEQALCDGVIQVCQRAFEREGISLVDRRLPGTIQVNDGRKRPDRAHKPPSVVLRLALSNPTHACAAEAALASFTVRFQGATIPIHMSRERTVPAPSPTHQFALWPMPVDLVTAEELSTHLNSLNIPGLEITRVAWDSPQPKTNNNNNNASSSSNAPGTKLTVGSARLIVTASGPAPKTLADGIGGKLQLFEDVWVEVSYLAWHLRAEEKRNRAEQQKQSTASATTDSTAAATTTTTTDASEEEDTESGWTKVQRRQLRGFKGVQRPEPTPTPTTPTPASPNRTRGGNRGHKQKGKQQQPQQDGAGTQHQPASAQQSGTQTDGERGQHQPQPQQSETRAQAQPKPAATPKPRSNANKPGRPTSPPTRTPGGTQFSTPLTTQRPGQQQHKRPRETTGTSPLETPGKRKHVSSSPSVSPVQGALSTVARALWGGRGGTNAKQTPEQDGGETRSKVRTQQHTIPTAGAVLNILDNRTQLIAKHQAAQANTSGTE
jgi:hypothetical protein